MPETRHEESHALEENQPPSVPIHQESTLLSQEQLSQRVKPSIELGSEDTPPINKKRQRMKNRNRCLRYLCCACCLPVWATSIIWFIIIAIIIVVVVLATMAGTFVMPSVDLAGVSTSPVNGGSQVTFTGGTFNINFGLIISLNNPNLLTIDLTNLKATAYYPNPNGKGRTQIGGGYLAEQFVPTYSHFNFTFPFAIEYDTTLDADQSVLNDIVSRCGLTGEEKQDLTIDYSIQLTAKVLFIKISPTISSSTSFTCPISANGALGGLGDGTLA
ncbi:unnamed protein product [Rhizopus stolonifer]